MSQTTIDFTPRSADGFFTLAEITALYQQVLDVLAIKFDVRGCIVERDIWQASGSLINVKPGNAGDPEPFDGEQEADPRPSPVVTVPTLQLLPLEDQWSEWTINENFRRIFEAISYKVPLRGPVVLQGSWDFQGLYTMRSIQPAGDASGYSDEFYTDPQDD